MQRVFPALLALLALALSLPLAATPVLQQATLAHARFMPSSTALPGTTRTLSLDTPDGPLDLELEADTRFSAQAARWVPAIRRGSTRLYHGHVIGDPDSWVRLSLVGGAWLGAVHTHGRLWLLDPAREHPSLARTAGAGSDDSLVFSLDDIDGLEQIDFGGIQPPPGALLSQPGGETSSAAPAQTQAAQSTASTTYHLGVSLVLDTEFQNRYGSNAESTAAGILYTVDGFYSNQVNTEVYLVAMKKLSSNGTLTSTDSSALLDAFTSYLGSSPVAFSGLAHLFSGKDFDGNTVGVAISALCATPPTAAASTRSPTARQPVPRSWRMKWATTTMPSTTATATAVRRRATS